MKKAFLILMLLAVSVGLFAQDDGPKKSFSFAPSIDMMFVPFQMVSRTGIAHPVKDEDPVDLSRAGMALGRGAGSDQGVSIGVGLNGSYGSIFGMGVSFRLVGPGASGGTFQIDSWTYPNFWFVPIDGLRIRVGNGTDGIFGAIGGAGWGSDWALSVGDHSFIWSGLSGDGISARYQKDGIAFAISIPGISQFGGGQVGTQGGNAGLGNAFNFTTGTADLKYRLMRTQIAAGYDIAGIGQVRFAYFGPNGAAPGFLTIADKDSDNPGQITAYTGAPVKTADVGASPRFQVAFKLQAVENLAFDIGARFALALTPDMILSYHDWIYTKDNKWEAAYAWFGYNSNNDTNEWKLTPPVNLGIGATYNVSSDIAVGVRADMSFGGGLEITKTKVTAATSQFVKDSKIEFPFWIHSQLYGTVKLPDVKNITIGGLFSFQSYGQTNSIIGDKDALPFSGTGAYAYDAKVEGSGYTGGIRVGGGAYVQIPMFGTAGGNLRTGVFFRLGDVNGVKEDTVITIPIGWSVSF